MKSFIDLAQLRKPSSKVKPQILKVQQITNNGRSVLLPLSFKSIKILNATADVASLANKRCKIEPAHSTQDDGKFLVHLNQ